MQIYANTGEKDHNNLSCTSALLGGSLSFRYNNIFK